VSVYGFVIPDRLRRARRSCVPSAPSGLPVSTLSLAIAVWLAFNALLGLAMLRPRRRR